MRVTLLIALPSDAWQVCPSTCFTAKSQKEQSDLDTHLTCSTMASGGGDSAAWTQVPQQGDLIVPGEEDSNTNDAGLENWLLRAENVDVSILDVAAVEFGFVLDDAPPGDCAHVNANEEEDEDINSCTDYDVAEVSDNEEEQEYEQDLRHDDDTEDEATSSPKATARLEKIVNVGKDHWKLVMFLMILMIFSIHQHYRYASEIARLEQENARMKQEQEDLRRLQAGWEREDEEWMLANNCYVHARLGNCATKYLEDVNSGLETFYEWGQAAWKGATSMTQPSDDYNAGVPKTASISAQAFSETCHAFSRLLIHAQDAGSKLFGEISHGVQASLRDVSASADETFNLIVEQARDAVEDGTAFTRPKQQ